MKKWQLVGTTVLGATVLLGACGGGNSGGSGSEMEKTLKVLQKVKVHLLLLQSLKN